MKKLIYRVIFFALFVFVSCDFNSGIPVKLYKDAVMEEPETENKTEPESEIKTEPETEAEPEVIPEEEPEPEEKQEQNNDSEPVLRSWTFMFYMAADNNLEPYGIQDLNEIEAGLLDDESVSVVVFLDRHPGYDHTNGNWDSSRIMEIKHDSNGNDKTLVSDRKPSSELDLYSQSETELDSGNCDTLKGFVDFCKRNYKADHYALVLWGAGSGWKGVCYDGTSNSLMPLPSMASVLQDEGFDFIVFDMGFGMSVENLYEFRNMNTVIAGFPGTGSSSGINYESFFRRFCESDRSVSAVKKALINDTDSDLYMMESSAINQIFEKIEDFGKSMAGYISEKSIQKEVLENFLSSLTLYKSSVYPCDAYVDVLNMADYFRYYENKNVSESSGALYECVTKSIEGKGNGALSIHLIPYISRNVPDQFHSENYVSGAAGNKTNKIQKCSFVNDSVYWCPTGKDKSFLDALFYRVLN